MPEITREEVREDLRRTAEAWERRVEWYADQAAHGDRVAAQVAESTRKTAAIYRLALAALEDAERVEWLDTATHQDDVALWVRSNQWHVVLTGDAYDRGFDGTSLRAAIDRARGV